MTYLDMVKPYRVTHHRWRSHQRKGSFSSVLEAEKRSVLFLDPLSQSTGKRKQNWLGLNQPRPLTSELTFREWHGTTFFFYDSSPHPEDTIKIDQYLPSRFMLAICTVLSSNFILTRNNEFGDIFLYLHTINIS